MAENVKGLNIEIGLDTTQLERGLSNVKNDLKANGQELKKVNKNMKFDINPVNSLQKKFDLLRQRIKLLNEQLSKEKSILAQMKDASEKGLISESKLQKQVQQVARLNDELESTSMQAKKVEYDLGQMSQKSSNNIGQMASAIKSKVAMIAMAIMAVVKLGTSVATTASDIREEANEAGIAMEAFQRLATAGQMLGVSQNSVKKSLLEVNGVLADIAGHNSTNATKALETLGLDLEKLQEMGTEGAFYEIINALNQVQDKNQKLNYATEIFGQRYATAILPMIEQGADAVKEFADNAEGIWTEEQADASAQIQNSMDDMKNDFLIIVSKLLPSIQGFVDRMRGILKKAEPFLNKLFDFLGKTLENVAESLEIIWERIEPILTLLSPVLTLIDGIAKLLNKLLENDVFLKLLSTIAKLLSDFFGIKLEDETAEGGEGGEGTEEKRDVGKDIAEVLNYMFNPFSWWDLIQKKTEEAESVPIEQRDPRDYPGANQNLFARNRGSVSGGNTYNVTIYTSASHFSIDEIDEEIGRQI